MTRPVFPIQFLTPPKIDTDTEGCVKSLDYDDIYFQNHFGQAESEYVFLQGNDLPQAWSQKKRFVIGETGFGTGLNFLTTWKQWQNSRKPNQHLEFISCELHPLTQSQLRHIYKNGSGLGDLPEKLIESLTEKYPQHLLSGIHRLNFAEQNISLTLIFADAESAFSQLDLEVHAWFLDGFNPANNPQMWSQELFANISRLSGEQTTLATFTVARSIKDSLLKNGFAISKRPGFGKKREMLTAKFKTERAKPVTKVPWAQSNKASKKESIAVIGAGIAGLTLADILSQRGQNVTLIDKNHSPCQEASGNPQAMVMPMLTLNDSVEARFYLKAFLHAVNYYHPNDLHQSGVLQLSLNEKDRQWQEKLLKRFDWPSSLLQANKDGLFYVNSGWLDTQSHAQRVLKSVKKFVQQSVTSLKKTKQGWMLKTPNQELEFDTVILANGIQTLNLLGDYGDYDLPLAARHGQISLIEPSAQLKNNSVVLYDGYVMPEFHQKASVGATFDHLPREQWMTTPEITANHWQRQLEFWQNTPFLESLKQSKAVAARAGIRVTTPDHMPVCGTLVNQDHFSEHYADLHHGKRWKYYPEPEIIENLYIFTGLGSRGFTSAPILAEYLCNQILGECMVLEPELQKSVHPNRFLYRKLKKLKRSF